MNLVSVSIRNFRCFGPEAQEIPLGNGLIALLGTNGAGKSAVLSALSKVFGLTAADRTLTRTDFHVPKGKNWETVGPIEMAIELRLELPELQLPEADIPAAAAMFKHLTVSSPEGTPYCIARLTATWSPSTLAEGDIDEQVVWLIGKNEKGEERTLPVKAEHRSLIAVHYIPATRDPIRHIRQSAGSILYGFLQAISWSDKTKIALSQASEAIAEAIENEKGMLTLGSLVESCWRELHKEGTHTNVRLQPSIKRIEDLTRHIDAVFQPAAGGDDEGVDRLSDGQRSLFYIALVAMSFDALDLLRREGDHGLEISRIKTPVLTVLAVEEPENHVSPHYLGRIVNLLRRMAKHNAGQVILSSHSPAIMARVDPAGVRYLSLNPETKQSSVRRITLPTAIPEQDKFVREAVMAYPELYFAKLVVFGEGDSEQLVIPRLMRAVADLELDYNSISFVPLGGRHVNHFWRLLTDLGIPYLTLLDLDFGRPGGGWARVKYVLEQFQKLGCDPENAISTLGKQNLARMHEVKEAVISKELVSWLNLLERHDVFFSSPLDLDFAMLEAFPKEYQKLQPDENGPRNTKDEALIEAVLGENSEAARQYIKDRRDSLFWYRYLFLGRGKPTTHSLALQELTEEKLKKELPTSFHRLIDRLKQRLQFFEDDCPF